MYQKCIPGEQTLVQKLDRYNELFFIKLGTQMS